MSGVLALDLSLNSTGYAWWDDGWHMGAIDPKSRRGPKRLCHVRDRVFGLEYFPYVDIVAIEGYAFARPNQAHQIGELGGVVRLALYDAGIEFVEVAPSSVKKYATGKGNAGKDLVRDAARDRFGLPAGVGSDECDAVWLCALVSEALGRPLVEVPKAHREAVVKVAASLGESADAA